MPMRVDEAVALFERLGEKVRGKTAEQIRSCRNRLLQKHHPDYGGSTQVTKEIIEAFGLLQNGVPEIKAVAPSPHSQPYRYRRPHEEIAEELERQNRAREAAAAQTQQQAKPNSPAADFLCDTCVHCSDEGKLIHCASRGETIFRMKTCHRYQPS